MQTAGAAAAETGDGGVDLEPAREAARPLPAPGQKRRIVTARRVLLGVFVVFVGLAAVAYQQRHQFSAQAADLSRSVIGDENTARVEAWYFRIQDRVDRTKYRLLGGDTDPFARPDVTVQFLPKAPQQRVVYYTSGGAKPGEALLVADTLAPAPFQLPTTVALRDNPQAGEGTWTTIGVPRSTPTDMLMAKTFIRPDRARPYASVGVLVIDSRRIRLNLVGGTADPGGDRGVRGPGTIAQEDLGKLLAALNGGFKGAHGGYGMVANGKEHRPLRNGLASVAVMKDGSIKMGEWGTDLAWDENTLAVRQNAVLLVKNGEVSRRVAEGNNTWGYVEVNSAEFITWRSAIGLTKDGNLILAAGNSLSAETLAKALWAAGAYTAMQLDINSPYVLLSAFFPQPDGSLKAERFMDGMPDSPNRFLRTNDRDFLYVTLDESRYRY